MEDAWRGLFKRAMLQIELHRVFDMLSCLNASVQTHYSFESLYTVDTLGMGLLKNTKEWCSLISTITYSQNECL